MNENKTCGRCKDTRPIDEFYNHKLSPDGKTTICKKCCDTDSVKYYQENKNAAKEKSWAASLKRNYNITVEQYNEMLEKQNGCCAICERPRELFERRLSVDHNHATNEIRGLLCTYCNHRVVGRHRDGALLRKIADYVEQGTGWFIPPKRKRPTKRRTSSSA